MKTKRTNTPALVVCRKHWSSYIIPGLISGLLLIGGIAHMGNSITEGLGVIVVAAAIFGICYLRIHSDYLALHEDIIEGKIGFIKTTDMVSPISKVQDLSVHSGLLGKIFGYSTVTVSTAGTAGTEYAFTKVSNADKLLRKYIELTNK